MDDSSDQEAMGHCMGRVGGIKNVIKSITTRIMLRYYITWQKWIARFGINPKGVQSLSLHVLEQVQQLSILGVSGGFTPDFLAGHRSAH